ncbi:MAG: acyl-CoA dehydrogenase family protein [Actinomycetota bacterium]
MELTWGEDYDVLAEIARAVFGEESPLQHRDRTTDFDSQVRQLAQLGWLELGDPRPDAIDAADLASIAGVFVEMGSSLVESPLLPLTTSRDVALLVGTDTALELAETIGIGTRRVIPVLHDPAWGVARPRLEEGLLTGEAVAVPFGEDADAFVVEAVDGETTVVAIIDAADVTLESMPNLGQRPLFALGFRAVPVAADAVLARGEEADRAIGVAQRRSSVLVAAQVHGAGTRLLDATVSFAKERHQFGGPIGRFQAVQYLCTDIAIGTHLTSAFTRNAARAVDQDRDAELHVALMRKQAARTAQEMVHAAHEVHAGLGFMVESNIHLFTKAARHWQFALGADEIHDRDIAEWLDQMTWLDQMAEERV